MAVRDFSTLFHCCTPKKVAQGDKWNPLLAHSHLQAKKNFTAGLPISITATAFKPFCFVELETNISLQDSAFCFTE